MIEFAGQMFASMGRKDRRRWAEVYVGELILDGRRCSIESMAARLSDGDEQCLQQFVNQSPWDPVPVRRALARRMNRELEPEAWVIDDTSFPKFGKMSVGARASTWVRGGRSAPGARRPAAALGVGLSDVGSGGADSIHLRRFCRISLSERVPDESTVRKLARRIGRDTGGAVARLARRQARPEADVLSGLCWARVAWGQGDGAGGPQARCAARRERAAGAGSLRFDGPQAAGISRTIRCRSARAKAETLALTEQTGELLERSVKDQGRPGSLSDRAAPGAGTWRERQAQRRGALEELADRCEKVARQICQRGAG